MTKYKVVNENGEEFGGPTDSFEEAKEDRETCQKIYDGHFYVTEVES